jgi:hypothetical protein
LVVCCHQRRDERGETLFRRVFFHTNATRGGLPLLAVFSFTQTRRERGNPLPSCLLPHRHGKRGKPCFLLHRRDERGFTPSPSCLLTIFDVTRRVSTLLAALNTFFDVTRRVSTLLAALNAFFDVARRG